MHNNQPDPPADKPWVDHKGRPEGTAYYEAGRKRTVTAPMSEDSDGNIIRGDAAIAAGLAAGLESQAEHTAALERLTPEELRAYEKHLLTRGQTPTPPPEPATSKPKATRSRSRESHRTRPGRRRTRSTQSSDDDPAPADPPPPPPWRLTAAAGLKRHHRELCVGVPPEQQTTGRFHVCCTYIALLLELERGS